MNAVQRAHMISFCPFGVGRRSEVPKLFADDFAAGSPRRRTQDRLPGSAPFRRVLQRHSASPSVSTVPTPSEWAGGAATFHVRSVTVLLPPARSAPR